MAWMMALGGIASGIIGGMNANNQANAKAQMTAQEIEQQFQGQEYLAQQARLYNLQDQNQKINDIKGFEKYAPASAMNFNGAGPPPEEQLRDTSGLDQFDPSVLGSLGAYNKAHPTNG